MKYFILFVISVSITFAAPSFSKSKKQLVKIYSNHTSTFYCGCDYNIKNKKNMIDRKSCGYIPRNERTKKGNINKRSRRIEWEHVMPAQNFGRQLSCWTKGDSRCIKKNGKSFKGRKCCSKVSSKFKEMEADKMNLVPAIGELNADRSNYRYGAFKPSNEQYGQCNFQVDFKARKAFIDPSIRGDVARIYFYMSDTYDIKLSKQERKMMSAWDKTDPIDKWEKEKLDILKK